MKKFAVLAVAFAVAGFMGCNTSNTGSGPTNSKNDTFTITGFKTTPSIKQGGTQSETIKINRNSDFKSDVKLSVEDPLPKGVKVEFEPALLKAGEKETICNVKVADDAPLGEAKFTIVGTPEPSGTSVKLPAAVKVEKK